MSRLVTLKQYVDDKFMSNHQFFEHSQQYAILRRAKLFQSRILSLISVFFIEHNSLLNININ